MKKALIFLLPVLVLIGLGYWFWKLGDVPNEEVPVISLIVEADGVQVRSSTDGAWMPAEDGMMLGEGWQVKTDATGLATVRFFDRGESRLANQTEITISTASIQGIGGPAKVGIDLGVGRIWSRVLRIFDVEGSYSVKTSAVVATVRGTAFDVSVNPSGETTVVVSDSAVSLGGTNAAPEDAAIVSGTLASYTAAGALIQKTDIPDDIRVSNWYMRNELADDTFVELIKERQKQSLERLGGTSPESALNGFASLSERFRLQIASPTAKESLTERYLARRFLHLIQLVQNGKAGLAAQEFSRLENDIRERLQGPDAGAERDLVRIALQRIAFLVEDANPDDALYPFKQRIEHLNEELAASSDVQRFYARLLAMDARLDEAKRLMGREAFEEARITLDGVQSGVENVRREVSVAESSFTGEERTAIILKINAIHEREQALSKRLEEYQHVVPSDISATSTQGLNPDSLEGLTPDATSTSATDPKDSEPLYISISLVSSPDPVEVGQTAKLFVKGKTADGNLVDLSTKSSFTVRDRTIGSVNGPVFSPIKAGVTVVTAEYQDRGGKKHQASATVTVIGKPEIESLSLSSLDGTTLTFGQTARLSATARYTDGTTKDVTSQTAFSISSGTGTLRDTTVTVNAPASSPVAVLRVSDQSVQIVGSYRESGKTLSSSVQLLFTK